MKKIAFLVAIVACVMLVPSVAAAEEYQFVTAWGTHGKGTGQFPLPKGIAADAEGHVYVADSNNHRIQKFNSTGTFIAQWGSYGTGEGEFNQPFGIAVGADGWVYVIDRNNRRVQKFDSTGTFVAEWGSEGPGEGEFQMPHGIAVDPDGYVYVADTSNHRIQMFSLAGSEPPTTDVPEFPILVVPAGLLIGIAMVYAVSAARKRGEE